MRFNERKENLNRFSANNASVADSLRLTCKRVFDFINLLHFNSRSLNHVIFFSSSIYPAAEYTRTA